MNNSFVDLLFKKIKKVKNILSFFFILLIKSDVKSREERSIITLNWINLKIRIERETEKKPPRTRKLSRMLKMQVGNIILFHLMLS